MSRFGRDYLTVGRYTDIIFPGLDVRFIAINDRVDSEKGDADGFSAIRNLFNEWYPRDTSKKIRAVFRQKGTSGKHIGNPVFGYLSEHTRGDYPSSSMGQSSGTSQEQKPKTKAGERTIPMLDSVKDAFDMLREEQTENGRNTTEIDGMRGFIFCNRFGNVPNPQSINRAIKRIVADYNAGEEVNAKKEHREAVMLPDFSAHHLRHTFCTRLCEQETNLKVIQSIMGHKDIQTTMDIYAEATEQKKHESFERLAAKLNVF